MSEVKVLISCFGFFLIVGLVLQMAGFSDQTTPSFSNEDPNRSFGNNTTEDDFTFTDTDRWICTLTGAGSVLIPTCRQALVRADIPVVSDIARVIEFISVFIGFMFGLVTFQIVGIPAILNILIIVPPAVALSYVGARLLRGGG
jgi:hypothetical protein